MKTLILAEGVGFAAAAQAAVETLATPFLSGRDVVAEILPSGLTGTPTLKIQGADLAAGPWVDLLTSTSLAAKKGNIKLRKFMRFNVTAAGTAGSVSAYCHNGA